MPIVVTYDDVGALGAAALATGQMQGVAARRRQQRDRDAMMLSRQYDIWQGQQQAGAAAAQHAAQIQYQRERDAANRQAGLREAELAYGADQARSQAQYHGDMADREHDVRLEMLRQQGRQDLEKLQASLKGPEAAPGEREAQAAQRRFQEYDDQVLVPQFLQGPDGDPERYKAAREMAMSHFLGGRSLTGDIQDANEPAEYEGFAPTPGSANQKMLAGLIQGGQFGVIEQIGSEIADPREQATFRGEYTGVARYAFEQMPLSNLQLLLARGGNGMPPEIRAMAEQVVREKQQQPYPGGFSPVNAPATAPVDTRHPRELSNAELVQEMRRQGMSDDEIRRYAPGLLT